MSAKKSDIFMKIVDEFPAITTEDSVQKYETVKLGNPLSSVNDIHDSEEDVLPPSEVIALVV